MHKTGNDAEKRRAFAFGNNWKRYATEINEERIIRAEASLKDMLQLDNLKGQTFLDAGCGSGIFSLAAVRLGAAKVHSFDYDPMSIATTAAVKERHCPAQENWEIEAGNVLDRQYLSSLGEFDIVYSWGVLHHTGAMWRALDNIAGRCAAGGKLYIAIYNDQGIYSSGWKIIKKWYNWLPEKIRWVIVMPIFARLWGPTVIRDLLKGVPGQHWKAYRQQRGMSPWRDVIDWVGGYPFEVASARAIEEFFREKNFSLRNEKLVGRGHGNNEFVFNRGNGE